MTTIGIVGLGLLGHAVASRLIKAGHGVVGFDLLPARVEALTALGGAAAPSAAAVARSAEAVCTLLPSLASVEEATLGAGGIVAGARPGLTVIQMSTISPTLTTRLAEEMSARKAGLDLDVALEVLTASAANSRMLELRGPMMARGEFPAQMKLDLFMKDLHLMQEAAAAVGAPLPLTDLAERLYAAAQAAGHGGEDLSVVVTALG